MPAPAVIPAPIAYIKIVAVKKLVVGFLVCSHKPGFGLFVGVGSLVGNRLGLLLVCGGIFLKCSTYGWRIWQEPMGLGLYSWMDRMSGNH